ncbi:transmembrane protein 267 [Chelonus insularis]|uniref:transmembrane protein 267 n=1 Tax=Chelonus insularis TaxID=460826 RepID=UPI00158A9081|nr:transmembrane protein 267 [Chelonus insularis]
MYNNTIKFLLSLLIGIISMAGDKLLENENKVFRAIVDNAIHSIIGGLSWILILVLSNEIITKNVCSIFLSMIVSSLIDLDHFIEARDWRLTAATSLKKRPFLHCTTLPIMIWLIFLLISRILHNSKLASFSWIILTSFLSHHIRDGTRRGLWLAPLGSTPNIPYYLYILLDMTLPFAIHIAIISTNVYSKNHNIINIV